MLLISIWSQEVWATDKIPTADERCSHSPLLASVQIRSERVDHREGRDNPEADTPRPVGRPSGIQTCAKPALVITGQCHPIYCQKQSPSSWRATSTKYQNQRMRLESGSGEAIISTLTFHVTNEGKHELRTDS